MEDSSILHSLIWGLVVVAIVASMGSCVQTGYVESTKRCEAALKTPELAAEQKTSICRSYQ
jgi:hypothetical protein